MLHVGIARPADVPPVRTPVQFLCRPQLLTRTSSLSMGRDLSYPTALVSCTTDGRHDRSGVPALPLSV
jgi:hypothetical protein